MSDIPITISAFSIGMYATVSVKLYAFRFMLLRPIAAAVPMIVEINAASRPHTSVVPSADMIALSWSIFAYQSNVKPVHTPLLFDSLNE